MDKKKTEIHWSFETNWVFSLVVTVIFALLAFNVDRAAIGPNDTEVGLSALNGAVAARFGYNAFFDKITDVTMVLAILTAAVFAVIGFLQLVREKSLIKVDKRIIGLGCVYVLVVVLYVFFDKVPLNYRPVLVPGETELEASFPSSHVMVIVTIMSTAVAFIKSFLAGKDDVRKWLVTAAEVIMIVAVVGRILAGVHWISDIIGGLLISLTISECYKALFIGKSDKQS